MRTHAAISSGSRRKLPHVAAARRVWARPRRRRAAHGPSTRTAGGVGWRACHAPMCGRRTGRVGVPRCGSPSRRVGGRGPRPGSGRHARRRRAGGGEARIGLAMGPFRLAGDPAFAAPSIACGPHEVREAARRGAALPAARLGRRQSVHDLRRRTRVPRQAEQVIDVVGLAREPRIGPQHDPRVRLPRPQQGHDLRSLLRPRPRRRCAPGAAAPPEGGDRTKRPAAGSNSNHDSRGKTAPPANHEPDRPSRRNPDPPDPELPHAHPGTALPTNPQSPTRHGRSCRPRTETNRPTPTGSASTFPQPERSSGASRATSPQEPP